MFQSSVVRDASIFASARIEQLDTTLTSADQVLPFDVTLSGANEYGAMCAAKIFGLKILNEGMGISIDNAVTEMQAKPGLSFVPAYSPPSGTAPINGRLMPVNPFVGAKSLLLQNRLRRAPAPAPERARDRPTHRCASEAAPRRQHQLAAIVPGSTFSKMYKSARKRAQCTTMSFAVPPSTLVVSNADARRAHTVQQVASRLLRHPGEMLHPLRIFIDVPCL